MELDKISSFIVMDVLERAQEIASEGHEVIHLEVGEPDFPVSKKVVEAATRALNEGCTKYTHSLGLLELRQEIGRYFSREYGVEVKPNQVVCCSGSSPAILMVLLALSEGGGEVILSNPGYACYKNFCLCAGLTPIEIAVSAEDGFCYNIDALRRTINPRTRAIFINSPMNPTGMVMSESKLREIASLGVTIISDEIYHGLTYGGEKPHSILEYTDNAFVLSGMSKRYGMTGMRLGYVVAPQMYMQTLIKLQQNLFICAPSSSQYAAIEALRSGDEDLDARCKEYDRRRRYLIDRLRSMGFDIEHEPMGAFYVYAKMPSKVQMNCFDFCMDVLEKVYVGITPGVDFGSEGEGRVRFSYANSLENITRAMDRLEGYLSKI